jgi:hypothetical protein
MIFSFHQILERLVSDFFPTFFQSCPEINPVFLFVAGVGVEHHYLLVMSQTSNRFSDPRYLLYITKVILCFDFFQIFSKYFLNI